MFCVVSNTGPCPFQSVWGTTIWNWHFYSMILPNLYFFFFAPCALLFRAGRGYLLGWLMTYSGAGEDRVFCGFHNHLVGRAPNTLLGLVVPQLLTDARHCRLRAVLRVRGIRPVVCVTGGHSKPDHAGGWLRRRCRQPVQPIGWRHLFKGIPYVRCYHPFTWWLHSRFKAQYCSGVAALPHSPSWPPTLLCVHLAWSLPLRGPLGLTAGAKGLPSAFTHWKGRLCPFHSCSNPDIHVGRKMLHW